MLAHAAARTVPTVGSGTNVYPAFEQRSTGQGVLLHVVVQTCSLRCVTSGYSPSSRPCCCRPWHHLATSTVTRPGAAANF